MSANNIRIAIVGTSGSGKSTLARKLSKKFNCKHIELDVYAWNPGWVKKTDEEILDSVGKDAKQNTWIACGNWSLTRELIWKEATHLVWLKLPARVVFWRLLKRTLINILTKKEIAGGNVETFTQQFFSKNSIFLWAYQTHWKRDETYSTLIASGVYDPLEVVILKSQKEIDDWASTQC